MNWKRFVYGLGAVLMCTSLVAYAADPPNTTATADDATLTQDFGPTTTATAPAPGTVKKTLRQDGLALNQDEKAATISGVTKKITVGTVQGGSRDVPVNDLCEDAIPVNSPFPATVCGTNEEATADCPNTLNWNAVWYEIELPYLVNNLVTNYCPTEESMLAYQVGTVVIDDCSGCGNPINGRYEIVSCGDKSTAQVIWQDLQGPGSVMMPVFINPAHEFCIEINVTEVAQPDNDLCENAEFVTGPYPVTRCGTVQGATVDCEGVLDWNAVWYEVDLPYEINTVETDYCPGEVNMSSDEIGVVYLDSCDGCADFVPGMYMWHDCGNYRQNPKVWWRDVPGPGTIFIPVFINPTHEYCIEFNVRDGDCQVPCPPESTDEGETCGDDVNGGCLMATPYIKPITCGETICGSGWAQGGNRDTDWFELTVDEPTIMTFTVESEFAAGIQAGLIETVTPGVVGCDQITGMLNPYTNAVDCEELVVEYFAYPGTYWWFISPDMYDGQPCGRTDTYVATMTCEAWEIRGACCDDEMDDCQENVLYQDCPEPMRFGKDMLCDELSPPCGGCPESMIELEIRTDRYPSETTWVITDHNDPNTVLFSGGPYQTAFETYIEYYCVSSDVCVDFTIYDMAGDGQAFGNGGYAVRYDEVELYSTLDSSWSGFEHHADNIGYTCATGRCCYSPWPNCADATLLDCVSLYDGMWIEGLTCSEDPCQNPDAPDFEVTAPYTSPERSTCGALDRCHPMNQYYDTPEHVYLVTIPHDGVWSFNTCLDQSITTWLALGTTMCGEDLGYASWTCNQGAEIVQYLTAGDYYADVEGYSDCGQYVFDVHEIPVCDTECPANSTTESEPCGENTNNGCWGYPNAFEPIAANETICGQIYADNGFDTDWFEYVAEVDDTVTFKVRPNFTAMIGIAKQNVPGEPGCGNFTGMIDPSVYTSDCVEASVTLNVTAGGTYYFYVGHQSSYNSPCGTTNDYVATLSGSQTLCGDLDVDGDCDTDDYTIFLDAFGSCVGDVKYVAAADFDGDECITLVDYQAWGDCYRDANPGLSIPTSPVQKKISHKKSGSLGVGKLNRIQRP